MAVVVDKFGGQCGVHPFAAMQCRCREAGNDAAPSRPQPRRLGTVYGRDVDVFDKVDISKQPGVACSQLGLGQRACGDGLAADEWSRHRGSLARAAAPVTSPVEREVRFTLERQREPSFTLGMET